MITTEEPILSRLDRLDKILKQLEDIRGSNNRSPRSSWASTTPSSGTHSRESDFSPESKEKHCRPIHAVVVETEMKGTLLERLVHVENQVLKLCLHLEEELEAGVKKEEKTILPVKNTHQKRKKKKGLKQLVKSCVEGGKTREI
ncbi:uncharacterized protein LOC130792638 [Actinidia eriantha]|uniref:uncharacterized protein LOC130792638 n=1 Tax=Actinidia eriantha TaxID=165200 RepID=UPI0025862061|nr:uncharacterized protein LOC130792638 [Actinidia eriantha]